MRFDVNITRQGSFARIPCKGVTVARFKVGVVCVGVLLADLAEVAAPIFGVYEEYSYIICSYVSKSKGTTSGSD